MNGMRWVALVVVTFGLSGCGRICVMGAGDCHSPVVLQQGSQKKLTLTPSAPSVYQQGELTFRAEGGRRPYEFSVQQGGGTVDEKGRYRASHVTGVVVVRVTDALDKWAEAAAIVVEKAVDP